MKKLLASLLLVLTTVSCGQVPPRSFVLGRAHDASFELVMTEKGEEVGHCSATAIGPHAILTAAHCIEPGVVYVVGERPIFIKRTILDNHDHAIFLVDVYFDTYVPVEQRNLQVQGQPIFMYGNPRPLADVYRQGYTAGHWESNRGLGVLMDLPCYSGDSGSGVFDLKGNLIGVLSSSTGAGSFQLCITYYLRFSSADLRDAISFNG